MKLLIAGILAASTLAIAVPASAQSIYVGPRGGVGVGIGGVGVGAGRFDGGYGYRDGYARRGPGFYEGRSAYPGARRGRLRDF